MTTRETPAEALARLYDLDLAEPPDDVDLYRALARRTGGPIVELAVGSGRIAVPLAADGHRVTGIDLDAAMLARAATRARAAGAELGARLELVEGDMLEVRGEHLGRFSLAILGLNSILLVPTFGGQRRAVAAMAELVAPDGTVVIDAWQPDPDDLVRFDGRLSLEWLRTDPETGREVMKLASARYDAARRIVTLTVVFEEAGPGEPPVRWTRSDSLRLVGADELVAFAEEAGMVVETLAGDHDLSPLDAASERVVLVARRPAQRPALPGR